MKSYTRYLFSLNKISVVLLSILFARLKRLYILLFFFISPSQREFFVFRSNLSFYFLGRFRTEKKFAPEFRSDDPESKYRKDRVIDGEYNSSSCETTLNVFFKLRPYDISERIVNLISSQLCGQITPDESSFRSEINLLSVVLILKLEDHGLLSNNHLANNYRALIFASLYLKKGNLDFFVNKFTENFNNLFFDDGSPKEGSHSYWALYLVWAKDVLLMLDCSTSSEAVDRLFASYTSLLKIFREFFGFDDPVFLIGDSTPDWSSETLLHCLSFPKFNEHVGASLENTVVLKNGFFRHRLGGFLACGRISRVEADMWAIHSTLSPFEIYCIDLVTRSLVFSTGGPLVYSERRNGASIYDCGRFAAVKDFPRPKVYLDNSSCRVLEASLDCLPSLIGVCLCDGSKVSLRVNHVGGASSLTLGVSLSPLFAKYLLFIDLNCVKIDRSSCHNYLTGEKSAFIGYNKKQQSLQPFCFGNST